jgi:hypothetical protein
MSDFESRLSGALSSGSERAPDASGLTEGARRRARRRRATVAGVAAAVVVAVAVPVGVIALHDGGSVDGDRADDPVTATTRIETWHGVSIEVPATWGYGGRQSWCVTGERESPLVERPGGIVPMIGCDPTFSWGVSFEPRTVYDPDFESGRVWHSKAADGGEYLPGTWHGFWYDGDVVVQVAARYQDEVQAIIDSAHRVDGVDANGCPVTREEGFATDSEQLSVCRYDGDGNLEQSERLSTEDTAAAVAALDAAPAGNPEMLASCDVEQPPRLVVQLISSEVNSEVVLQAPCPLRPGITSGGESFQDLTQDVLYWALSPGWSGALANGIPLPNPLRALSVSEPTDPPVAETACPDGKYANSDFALDPDNGGPMTVCRMELDWDGESGGSYLLTDTTELSQAESDSVRAALQAAPVQEQSVSLTCGQGRGEFFLVTAGDAVPLWVYNEQCGEMTAITADGSRKPTAELLDALGSAYGPLQ